MPRDMNDFRKAASFAHVQGHDMMSGGAWIAHCARCGVSAYADDGVWGQKCPGMPMCQGPECTRPAVRSGLCHAHSAQAARGTPLHPLRPPRPALASVSLRVSAAARGAVLADVEGARAALEAWAKRR